MSRTTATRTELCIQHAARKGRPLSIVKSVSIARSTLTCCDLRGHDTVSGPYNDLNTSPRNLLLETTTTTTTPRRVLMPMLERTAASLEPCNFHRVLPPTKTPFKSSRRLHTAFWQHGAADIELSSVWQTLVREPLESLNLLPAAHSQPMRTEPPSASTFLLDFLYPQGATSLLRKLSPSALGKYERPRLYLRGTVPRLFTSSASSSHQPRSTIHETTATSLAEDVGVQEQRSFREHERFEEDEEAVLGENEDLVNDEYGKIEQIHRQTSSDAQEQSDSHIPYKEYQALLRQRQLEKLRNFLETKNDAHFDSVWQIYHSKLLLLSDRDAQRTKFLDYVTKHRSMSHALALAIKSKHWKTVWDIWERYPKAHHAGEKALKWSDFEPVLEVDEMMLGLIAIVTRIQHSKNVPGKFRQADPELSDTLLRSVVYPCIHRYHQRSEPKHYLRLLKALKDPLLYEEFLSFTTSQRMAVQSHELYTAYRRLPNVKIRGHIMHKMINRCYYPDDPAGMELVMKDFYARFGRLDIQGYRKYLDFYARRGDVKSVERMWEEYTTHYAEQRKRQPHHRKALSDNPDFQPLLHVYAIRGELGEVRRVFSTAQQEYGPRLTTISWNILLNAHAKAGEYDAAVRVFGVLRQSITPDLYSYGTMMGMSGSRGDLEFTLELYRLAKSQGLKPNVTMIDCVVEAYCQNDKFKDAESIVTMTTKNSNFKPSELVGLWNTLLDHHATRRDLTNVNRLLTTMTEQGIPYDSDTYAKLLKGLALCRQPHHALYLVQQAVKSRSFKPTLQHYALLMSAFLRTGQYAELLRTSTVLRGLGMPQTGQVLLHVLQALGAWAQNPPGGEASKSRTYLLSALRQFRKSIEWSQEPQKSMLQRRRAHEVPWLRQTPSPDTVMLRTEQTSVLIFTFAQMREVTSIEDILRLWKSSSPETSNMQEPPIKLLQSLMVAAFYEGHYREVHEIWQLIFKRIRHASRVSSPGTQRDEPLPSMRYVLNEPLKTVQRTYAVNNDIDGLRTTVASVLHAGFRLDSKNWNYYVQLLAEMKKWREAFMVCEERLMPFWRGWYRVRARMPNVQTRLPLPVRRRGMNPHYPRPISYTLMVLSKAYMDLEQMSAWSSEADRLLSYITQKAPSTMGAIKSQLRTRAPLEQRLFMSETGDEDKQRGSGSVAKRRQMDEGIPEAFQQMMDIMTGTAEAEAIREQENVIGGRAPDAATATATDAAYFDGEYGFEDVVGDEWYDVIDPDDGDADDDTWAPMAPGQISSDRQELAEDEAASVVDSAGPSSTEAEPKNTPFRARGMQQDSDKEIAKSSSSDRSAAAQDVPDNNNNP